MANLPSIQNQPVNFTAPLTTLADAEIRLSHLDRMDLAVRLKKGEIYKTIRDKKLYLQEDYESFEDWVRYSQVHKGGTLTKVKTLISIYEIFVLGLKLNPESMRDEGISYTALRTILPYVHRGVDYDGQMVITNRDAVMGYLEQAKSISSEELKSYLQDCSNPDANRSMIKFERIDLVGNVAVLQVKGIDDLYGPKDAGLWNLTPRCYEVLRDALAKSGRLIMENGIEPSRLRQQLT
jgi:hypothetical protein